MGFSIAIPQLDNDSFDAAGLRTTGTDDASEVWQETFLRPRDTFGALLQFVKTTRDWNTPTRDVALEDVLAGRVVWREYVPCLRDAR